jgi:methylthioribose-1-phosphate isomerase
MNVNGQHFRTIWLKEPDTKIVQIINQQALPHRFEILDLSTVEDIRGAIKDMYVRGAGLIGAAAAYGMYLAANEAGEGTFDRDLLAAAGILKNTRPTASNLAWAVDAMLAALTDREGAKAQKVEAARREAGIIADADAEFCRNIGVHGCGIIEALAERKRGKP